MCLTVACEAVCCAGTQICNLACCCCKYFAETTLKEQIKLAYILLNYLIMAFTVIALYYIQDFYINYLQYFGCPEGISNLCLGISGIYRMSFVLTIFYIIILLFMCQKGWLAKMINDGLWLLKLIFIAVFFYGTLYMPNRFFEVFVDISIVASGIYQLFQIIIYIDIFYLWAEKWARMYDDGIEGMGSALVAAASLTFTLALILNIYNFIWFDHNYIINLINIAIIILLTVVQLFGFNPSGSLLATGCISCYITYQTFSALSSYPNADINIFYDSEKNMKVQMFVNGILNFIALIYIIFATQEQSKQALAILDKSNEKKRSNQNSNQQIEIEMTSTQQMNEAKALIEQIELQPYSTNQYIVFHIVMTFCSMYMAMMITNWGSPSIRVGTFELYMPSQLSYNVKIGSSWICSGLYFWTLIAPRVLPNRFN
ncbi:unnamed protein product [Paramecium octaurelia]|uniref:Transmembrane protein n=1 Tax=Paramecium octaurelia TaxID=43137 RepID=A0A8S1ULV2_PAROT|nr:unnamed protein product [Paramecium octaurelia]